MTDATSIRKTLQNVSFPFTDNPLSAFVIVDNVTLKKRNDEIRPKKRNIEFSETISANMTLAAVTTNKKNPLLFNISLIV